ncbi:hypothetical protein SUGI_1223530 [Cryptomeria japonica]|uniref:Secreted protein n=1 Tax=Cryptomeria japonica TaxID=3369 RepID=A0AAD3RMD4_CRYJA|nr:hypothetical protein SUGI_1223530 [Cryptomeria japonica]
MEPLLLLLMVGRATALTTIRETRHYRIEASGARRPYSILQLIFFSPGVPIELVMTETRAFSGGEADSSYRYLSLAGSWSRA